MSEISSKALSDFRDLAKELANRIEKYVESKAPIQYNPGDDRMYYRKGKDILDAPNGIYRVYWGYGGYAVASIGVGQDGKKYFADAAHMAGRCQILENVYGAIERLQAIEYSHE